MCTGIKDGLDPSGVLGVGNSPVNNTPTISRTVCNSCSLAVVQVRPSSTYKGEFGFDWIRMGDTQTHGDMVPYKKIKLLIVPLITDIGRGIKYGQPIQGSEKILKKILKQALIDVDITVLANLNVTSSNTHRYNRTHGSNEATFKDMFTSERVVNGRRTRVVDKETYTPVDSNGIQNANSINTLRYLNTKLLQQFPTQYQEYVVRGDAYVLYFSEEAGRVSGYGLGNESSCIYFKGHNKGTIVHELLHTMGLPHTFSNAESVTTSLAQAMQWNAKFTYQKNKTLNMMDYSFEDGHERVNLFHWQWQILNGGVNNA